MNTKTLLKYAPWALFGGLAVYAAYVFWPRPAPAEPLAQAVDQPNELGYGGDPFLTEPITAPKETFGIAYPGGSVTFDESAGSGQLNQILF